MTFDSAKFGADFRPKYISFDCYGTLIRFRMSEKAREFFSDRIAPKAMDEMCRVFSNYRFDETLEAWKPYREVLRNAVRRTSKAMGVEYRVLVGRGHEPSNANHRDIEIPHIGCLPAVVGL